MNPKGVVSPASRGVKHGRSGSVSRPVSRQTFRAGLSMKNFLILLILENAFLYLLFIKVILLNIEF